MVLEPRFGFRWHAHFQRPVTMATSRDLELALVQRLQRRDVTALPELYDLCGDRLYAFVLNIMDRDHGIAEDVVQDVWLTAVRSISKYEGRSSPYTWLCGIALHKVQDFWRRKARDVERRYDPPADVERAESMDLIDTTPLPEEIVESEETKRIVRRAIASLPEHYRTILLLKYVEQLSAREIGELLDKSPKSVESLLGRARLALRDRIGRADRGP